MFRNHRECNTHPAQTPGDFLFEDIVAKGVCPISISEVRGSVVSVDSVFIRCATYSKRTDIHIR